MTRRDFEKISGSWTHKCYIAFNNVEPNCTTMGLLDITRFNFWKLTM